MEVKSLFKRMGVEPLVIELDELGKLIAVVSIIFVDGLCFSIGGDILL